VPIPSLPTPPLPDFDELVGRGRVLDDVTSRPPNRPGSGKVFPLVGKAVVERRSVKQLTFTHTVFDFLGKCNFIAGQSFLVARDIVPTKGRFEYELRRRLQSLATVSEVSSSLVRAEFSEPWVTQSYTAQVDREFLESLHGSFGDYVVHNPMDPALLPVLQKQLAASVRAYSVHMIRYFFFVVVNYFEQNDALDALFAIQSASDLFARLLCEVFSTRFSAKVKSDWVQMRVTDFLFTRDEGRRQLSSLLYKVPGDAPAFARFLKALVAKHQTEVGPLFQGLLSASMRRFVDPDDTVTERLLRLVPNRYQFVAPTGTVIRFKRHLDLPPASIGYIPILGLGHMARLQIDSVDIANSMTDSTFSSNRSLDISFSLQTDAVRFGILPIPKYLTEEQFFSPLGSIHVAFVTLSFILSIPTFDRLNGFLKSVVVPRIVQAEGFIAGLFLFSLLSPMFTRLSWAAEDVTPEIVEAFEGLRGRYAGSVKELKPLSRNTELGIFMSASVCQLMTDLMTASFPKEPSVDQIKELYAGYQKLLSQQREGIVGVLMGLFALFTAVGHDLPVSARFPYFLLADVYSKFGAPTDPEADFIANYGSFVKHSAFMAQKWQRRWDEDLSRILRDYPAIANATSIDAGHPALGAYPALRVIPLRLVWSRIRLIQMLNEQYGTIMKFIPSGSRAPLSLIAQLHSCCRSVIATAVKVKRAEEVVVNGAQRVESKLEMKFNRYASREFQRNPNSSLAKSLMHQLVEQFESDPERLPRFNKTDVPWHVELVHEGATDVGGPARDCFTDVCIELMHPSLRLFLPSPNMAANHGAIRDLLIPNPEEFAPGTLRERLFYYAGVVLSVCYISRLQAPFRFARFVWGALTGTNPSIEDIFEIDDEFQLLASSIVNAEDGGASELQWAASRYTFEIKDSLGRLVELFPGGSQVPVTFERRLEFLERAQKYRLREFTAPLEALRRGFHVFFPPMVAELFAPWEIELLCCGPNNCPVEELKKMCVVEVAADAERLWRILDQMTPQERMMFVKFGTGRGGLPPPGVEWQSKLQIFFRSSNRPDMARELPTAETCFSKIMITRYDSDEVYLLKLRAAMTLGVGVEDHTPDWHHLREFTV
jgi:hypothetical protein